MNKDRMQKMLMRQIQSYSFVTDEVALYLDTHPTDKNALAAFDKYNTMQNKLIAEYTESYGPINQDMTPSSGKTERWSWVDMPWPWQIEEDIH